VDNLEVRFIANGIGFAVNFIQFTLLYQPTPSDYLNLGRSLQLKGRINPAITAYKKSFSPTQKFNSLKELADFLTRTGYKEEASIVYYKIANSNDSNLEEKISACESALEIKPQWLEMTAKLSELYENLGQLEDAIQNYQKQLETSPDWIEGYLKLAEIHEKIGQIDLAIHFYQRILEIEWDYPEVYVRIRKIRREMGIFQRDVSREPVADSELVLSVVVQTYNRATRLQKSLESYVKTDRSDIEFLICDNHSTDNTEELIHSFMAVDKRIRYIKNYTNLGASRNGFIGFVSAKAPLVMFITDDDYMTEGFVDAVIFIFDHFPTVGAVLNPSQNHHRLDAYSKNLRGGELYKKGKETVLSAALSSGQLCGSTYRRETVDYRLWNVNDSMIAAVWLSSDLAMRHDIYILFLKTEYTTINAYVHILTKDGQQGSSSMLYRTKNGFLNWDVGAAEMVDFPLYLINRLGLSSTEKWQFYHGRVAGLFQGWLWAHFRLWYPEDVEGAFIFLSRVLRHPYIRFSMLFWQIMIRESLSPSVNVTVQDRITIIMLGCFMLIWRLIIYLRDLIDPGLADIYYTGVWPRKDTIQLKHSQAALEIELSRDIGYSALTVVHDLQYELENL
jgi:glycosyltransferase involved in cell wall biosynthesis